jgi:hypothetical protein
MLYLIRESATRDLGFGHGLEPFDVEQLVLGGDSQPDMMLW